MYSWPYFNGNFPDNWHFNGWLLCKGINYRVTTVFRNSADQFFCIERTKRYSFLIGQLSSQYWHQNSSIFLQKLQKPTDEYTEGFHIPFVSFLRVIIWARRTETKRYFNTHWMPYFESCSTCSMNYDFITKQESSFTDANFVLNVTGLSKVTYLLGQYQDSLLLLNGVKSWFGNVPNEIIQDLYKLYFPDFILFNYTVTEFLH